MLAFYSCKKRSLQNEKLALNKDSSYHLLSLTSSYCDIDLSGLTIIYKIG